MLEKIPSSELRVGMYIHAFCGKWLDHPFIGAGFVLRNAADVQEIRGSGQVELWINTSKGLGTRLKAEQVTRGPGAGPTRPASPLPTSAARSDALEDSPGESTVLAATRVCRRSVARIGRLFTEARMGHALDASLCEDLVDEISELFDRSPSTLLAVARLKRHDDYTYMHSMSVCALMMALGKRLGLPSSELRSVGMGGLLLPCPQGNACSLVSLGRCGGNVRLRAVAAAVRWGCCLAHGTPFCVGGGKSAHWSRLERVLSAGACQRQWRVRRPQPVAAAQPSEGTGRGARAKPYRCRRHAAALPVGTRTAPEQIDRTPPPRRRARTALKPRRSAAGRRLSGGTPTAQRC